MTTPEPSPESAELLSFSQGPFYTFQQEYETSRWRCHMFGGHVGGFIWRPYVGEVPNWFWRKMQFLCFGNRWEKVDE
jgi:hypothetical protein